MSDILNDLRFWAQTLEDSRRTLICPPGRGDEVRALLDREGIGGMFDVQESPLTDGHVLLFDHHAVEASTRQAIQRMRP